MSQLVIVLVYSFRCYKCQNFLLCMCVSSSHKCHNCLLYLAIYSDVTNVTTVYCICIFIQVPQISQLFIVYVYLFRCHKCHNCLSHIYIYSGATNVISRAVTGLVMHFCNVNTALATSLALFVASVSIAAYPLVETYFMLSLLSGLFGFSTGRWGF